VREDGTRRPAFAAFQVAANYLAGFTGATLDQRGDYAQVTVKRGEAWTTVAWTRQPSPVRFEVAAHAAQATVVDANGRTQRISAQNGKYTIELAGATCTGGCIIGGAPKLIVEGSTAVSIAPVSSASGVALQSTPTLSGTVVATVTISETIESTATLKPTTIPTVTSSPTKTATATATSTATTAPEPTSTATMVPTITSTATRTPRPTRTATATPVPLSTLGIPSEVTPLLIAALIVCGAVVVSYGFIKVRRV
jgi:hypothetical protein